jgi:hypothetical protein
MTISFSKNILHHGVSKPHLIFQAAEFINYVKGPSKYFWRPEVCCKTEKSVRKLKGEIITQNIHQTVIRGVSSCLGMPPTKV